MIVRTENPLNFRPCMVLAYADSARAALNARHFRRLGWEVHQTASGPEARRLVSALRPQVVIMDTELRGESGWLTCAKLTLVGPVPRIILVDNQLTPLRREFAEMVGATAIIPAQAELPALLTEVLQPLAA